MINIKVLSSGSDGNCYIITSQTSQIVLECGIKYDKILREIDTDKLNFYLTSHNHSDHFKAIKEINRSGYDWYGVDNLENKTTYNFGEWKISTILVPHGKEKCYTYIIINNKYKKRILFATDCEMLPEIKDIYYDLMMLEINYSEKTIREKASEIVEKGYLNHNSLEDCKNWLSTKKVLPQNIMVIHTSNRGYVNEQDIYSELQGLAEKIVIAKKGVEITI